MLPQRIIADLESALEPDDLVISDVGAHKMWVAKRRATAGRIRPDLQRLRGHGHRAARRIGAKMAWPDRKVVSVSGDGGLMMNVQELETAVRLGWRPWSLIFGRLHRRDPLEAGVRFGRTARVELSNPDFVALARAFGAKA